MSIQAIITSNYKVYTPDRGYIPVSSLSKNDIIYSCINTKKGIKVSCAKIVTIGGRK